jgi:hypothetical protein
MLAVLDDPRLVNHPGNATDLRRHTLRATTNQHPRLPGRVGQKLLHRLAPRRRLFEPKQRRLQTLAPTVLDQPPHVQVRVFALPPQRKRICHLLDEPNQPLAPTVKLAAARWQASRVDVAEATTVQHRTALNRALPTLDSPPTPAPRRHDEDAEGALG